MTMLSTTTYVEPELNIANQPSSRRWFAINFLSATFDAITVIEAPT